MSFGFLSSFTLSAYLNVFKVCSEDEFDGEKLPIITVLQLPIKESFKTNVNFDPLKGVWFLFKSNARIHSFNANNDLLISAPSNLVYLFVSLTSAPLSLPAKSINDNFPWDLDPSFNVIYKIAWDLEESLFDELDAVILDALPCSITFMSYSTDYTFLSYKPTIFTFPFASSLG